MWQPAPAHELSEEEEEEEEEEAEVCSQKE
jgi:hypothetical protein